MDNRKIISEYRKELLLKYSIFFYGMFLGIMSGMSAMISIKLWLFGAFLYLIIAFVFWISYNRYDIGGLDG